MMTHMENELKVVSHQSNNLFRYIVINSLLVCLYIIKCSFSVLYVF